MNDSSWSAEWITPPWDEDQSSPQPCPYLRTTFQLDQPVDSVRRAQLRASSLGLYLIQLNGTPVSDSIFVPGWTSYRTRLQYQIYDVRNILIDDRNGIGAVLGDGWYRGYLRWDMKRNLYGDRLAFLAQLEIQYEDGATQLIETDSTWRAAIGAIRSSDIYLGETYDARLEIPDWSHAGFDDSGWDRVVVHEGPGDILVPSESPPVRRIEELQPVDVLRQPDGSQIFDMGQNMVGRVRLTVSGDRGTQVRLRHAEMLKPDGSLYRDNLRDADQEDRYFLSGEGVETYEPIFTFHGFRYVEIRSPGIEISPDDVTGIVIHSDMDVTGSFECSNPLLNQLQHNIVWGLKGNFLDVPTDCPQRDERLGWTGDAQVFIRTAAFNMDVESFFRKWLADLAADQLPDGSVPWVVPDVLTLIDDPNFGEQFGHGATGWGDAATVIPWVVYELYGNADVLDRQYESMKAWVEFIRGRARDGLVWEGDRHFGDWLAFAPAEPGYPGATTSKDLLATAYYAKSSGLLARSAAVLGRDADAAEYASLADRVRTAFVHEFVTPGGKLVSETQTAYAIALSFGLVPDDLVNEFVQWLADDVAERGHLTTGFLGTPELCHVLSDHGRLDLAYMLLLREEYPSWLYPVTQGATTIWERWDGQKPDGTFQDPGMNSFNHYAYGAIGDWMYRVVGGINPDSDRPGYEHVIIQPRPGGGLTHAKTSLETRYGLVRTDWFIEGDQFHLEVEIPSGSSATIRLPSTESSEIDVGPGIHRYNLKI